MQKYLSGWDKTRILPQITAVESRNQCDTTQRIFGWDVSVPLIPASMHSIISQKLIDNVDIFGSFVPQPREIFLSTSRVCYSSSLDRAMIIADKLPSGGVLFIEIANAYQWKRMEKIRSNLFDKYPNLLVVGGTVAEHHGAKFLQDIGYNGVLLGIGTGLVCETTTRTGVGLPAIASLMDCKDKNIDIPIILSGGVRTYGDFCKAIALGADLVMSGSLFKSCTDTFTKGTAYWGEASKYQKRDEHFIEGNRIVIDPIDKKSDTILLEAKEALQSAMSYSNSFDLGEFRKRVNIVELI